MLIEDQSANSATKSTSSFSSLPDAPVDEIFSLNHAYATDPNPNKVNLSLGVYRTEEGQPWPLSSVEQVEQELHSQNNPARHEYLPIEGDREFLDHARDLMFGFNKNDTDVEKEAKAKKRIASVQSISGTGANHLGAAFLAHHLKPKHVWVSIPTWANHHTIWELQGIERKGYPYFDASTCAFNFEGAITTLENEAEEGDVILLHACAHNPTGVDPSKEQWKKIAELCQRKRLFPFFDSAYQGFASGSADEDAWAVRYFFNLSPPLEMCVAQSFSKNFGLYGHRTGAFHLVTNGSKPAETELVRKNLCHIIRGEYSMGPRYGSTIVKRVLGDSALRAQWQKDLTAMSSRIKRMRQALYDELVRLNTPGSWEHIINQNGMFSYTGLTLKQVLTLRNEFHIYLLKSGRASVSGFSEKNVAYVAQAIDNVVRRDV
ncbi:aspartate transaminase, putative [Talaromyces stipitatus ATCC 10500]|uniref:aspartate transaminase n=1 Tax=Talaromyces stipitatus (strain ATCC 10500 / CBS 375.48 / QM 6759 / NRRL 1006) TaxID=441959 RepID=B8M6F1_TALSN|nr:aspartate transaminase, putative [Talaromyces stipitatus ATCC 10500]EED19326.1 aspartate transaminase, putative [Talaromyces stipitatus ATCC 10500]